MTYFDLTRDDHAYVFGLLQTDGSHFRRNSGARQGDRRARRRDAGVLHQIQPLFTCYSSITARTRTTNFAEISNTVVWATFAADFRAEVATLGLPPGPKSKTVRAPTTTFDAVGYLRGLLDGDGSVGFTSHGYPFLTFHCK